MFAVRLRRTASALHLVRDVYVCGSISTNNCASGFHSKRNIQVAVENVRNSDRGSDKLYRDRLKVTARAGDGGAGCVSFWQSTAKGMVRLSEFHTKKCNWVNCPFRCYLQGDTSRRMAVTVELGETSLFVPQPSTCACKPSLYTQRELVPLIGHRNDCILFAV